MPSKLHVSFSAEHSFHCVTTGADELAVELDMPMLDEDRLEFVEEAKELTEELLTLVELEEDVSVATHPDKAIASKGAAKRACRHDELSRWLISLDS